MPTENCFFMTPKEAVKFIKGRSEFARFLASKNINAPATLAPFLQAAQEAPEDSDIILGIADHVGAMFGYEVAGEYWRLKGRAVVKVIKSYDDVLHRHDIQLQLKLSLDSETSEKTMQDLFMLLEYLKPGKDLPKANPIFNSISMAGSVPCEDPRSVAMGLRPYQAAIVSQLLEKKANGVMAVEGNTPKRRYFLIPIKWDEGSGIRRVYSAISNSQFAFTQRSMTYRKPIRGDKVCFYVTGSSGVTGAVAQAELGETNGIPFWFNLIGACILPNHVKVQNVIDDLDFFRYHRVKRYGLITQEVKEITEHDFNVLSGTERISPLMHLSDLIPC